MKSLINIINERLRIRASHKDDTYDLPENVINTPLYLSNNKIEFPVILEIDHKYNENIIGYRKIEIGDNQHLEFYNDKNEKVCSMNWKEITSIFDNEKGIMLNTKYGWLGTIWRQ